MTKHNVYCHRSPKRTENLPTRRTEPEIPQQNSAGCCEDSWLQAMKTAEPSHGDANMTAFKLLTVQNQYFSKKEKKSGEERSKREESWVGGCERKGESTRILCSECHGDLTC